jgi:pimeloyl-ACP methyl ester carboxylesterase
MPSTSGFLREYLLPRPGRIELKELTYQRLGAHGPGERGPGEVLPARLYRLAGPERPRPAWVLLHGLTYYGRAHPSLDRFARALAASGATIIVPEIPEWSALRVAPATTGPSIAGAIDTLIGEGYALEDRIGVFGFSFGATQALAALAEPALAARVRTVVAWGGYCDLHQLFRFGLTGSYELDGMEAHAIPDPYGTWIMGANFVERMPGHERYAALASALANLARESGRAGVPAGDASYDPLKDRLRQDLPAPQREIFDLLAPPSARWPNDSVRAVEFAHALADAALATDSRLDPRPALPALDTRTLIAHGRDDQLIPYTESLRLHRALPSNCVASCTITSLFAHSTGASRGLGALVQARELARFCTMLHRLLRLI